jgi:hypothetical protein
MKLSNFIDFSVFAEYDDSWDDDVDFFICKKDPAHEYYISQDIEGVDRTEGIKMIEKASKSFKSYTKMSNSPITKNVDEDSIKDVCFYQSNDNAFYCFYVSLDYDGDTIYFSALLDRKHSKYLAIGCQGEHLFVKHHVFNYGDGSGYGSSEGMVKNFNLDDSESDTLSKKSHPDEILYSLETHFNTICDNMYGPNTTLLGPLIFKQKSNKMLICDPKYSSNDHRYLKNVGALTKGSGWTTLQIENVAPGKYYAWATLCNHGDEILELCCLMDPNLESVEWSFLDKIISKNQVVGIHDLKYYKANSSSKANLEEKWVILEHSIVSEIACHSSSFDVWVSRDDDEMVNGVKIAYKK